MSHLVRYQSLISSCARHRCLSFNSTKSSSAVENNDENPPPPALKCDMIGPPKQLSNLRPVAFYIPENETLIEKRFREERIKVQKWNEDFWNRHNSAFMKESREFRTRTLESSSQQDKTSLSADEMSEFYKAFLDKNWKTHVLYNFEWYQKNFKLLYLSFAVKVSKLHMWK